MKKLIGLFVVIFIANLGQVFAEVKIGDAYQGGKVAYILVSGDPGYVADKQHGLIAAETDQDQAIRWWKEQGNFNNNTSTESKLGTGRDNTKKIIAVLKTGDYAAQSCVDYTNEKTGTGVYSDWYLPSKDELSKLFLNKEIIGSFAGDYYWSSSEASDEVAWCQNFINGEQRSYFKDFYYRVRCIRSF